MMVLRLFRLVDDPNLALGSFIFLFVPLCVSCVMGVDKSKTSLGNKQKQKYSLADHGGPYKKVRTCRNVIHSINSAKIAVRDGLQANIWRILMARRLVAYIQLLGMCVDCCRGDYFNSLKCTTITK